MWAVGIVLYMLLTGEYPFEMPKQAAATSDFKKQQLDIIINGAEVMHELLDDNSHISDLAKQLITSLVV